MRKYTEFLELKATGRAIAGASVRVLTYPGGALATVYSDDGVTETANPLTTDPTGELSFYAANGHYTLEISGAGLITKILKDISIFDEDDLFDATSLADYTELRAYAGAAKKLEVTGYRVSATPIGIAGQFTRDDSDTTSADNGGTIIVASNGKRWKRVYAGAVDAKWYGAKYDSTTDDGPAIRAAVAAHLTGEIWISGASLVGSTINLNGFGGTIVFKGRAARLLAGANNLKVFESTTNAYGTQIIDARVFANGHTGVTAFDLTKVQLLGAALVRPYVADCQNGIVLRSLCWGLEIDHPNMDDVANPIVLISGNNAVQINHPCVDGFTGTAGVDIQAGGAFPNVGNQINNGFVQNGTIGVRDGGYNTQVLGTYFEGCSSADVSLVAGSFYFLGLATNHTASGAVAYKGRSAIGAMVKHPFMSSGGRTTGLFDFDGTNSNCEYDAIFSSDFKNSPLGTVTGINTRLSKPGAIGSVIPNSGAFTTLSATGAASLTTVTSTGRATLASTRTNAATVSISASVATTVFSITAANRGRYEISAWVANSGTPAQFTAIATVIWDGAGGRIIANNGTNLTLTLSGGDVQVTQTSGTSQSVSWSYLYMN